MIGLGWLTLKQAQDALRAGRLDEAYRLLSQPHVQGHKRCPDLLRMLLQAYVQRSEEHLRRDDETAAWNELLKGEQTGIADNSVMALRQALTKRGLAEVRSMLETGDPSRAAEACAQLRQRAVRHFELDTLEDAAKDWTAASELAERGDFSQALQTLERVGRLSPGSQPALHRLRQKIEAKQRDFSPRLVELHAAAQQEQWQDVLRLSEDLLTQAPHHKEVRKLRTRAWKSVDSVTPAVPAKKKEKPAAKPEENRLRQFILWIDGVGGFLTCLENRVTIGQAGPECVADVPLFADVSRLHARLIRDAEGYVLEAVRTVSINGESVERHLLRPGQRFTLGETCQLQFRQDVPISASARLDMASGHRFGRAIDGVLLMAETLVLGPGDQAHVGWRAPETVVLYRNKEEIGIRSEKPFTINGRHIAQRGNLEPGAVISGEGFTLSVELLPAALVGA